MRHDDDVSTRHRARGVAALLLLTVAVSSALAGCAASPAFAPPAGCLPRFTVTPDTARAGDSVTFSTTDECDTAVPDGGWRIEVQHEGANVPGQRVRRCRAIGRRLRRLVVGVGPAAHGPGVRCCVGVDRELGLLDVPGRRELRGSVAELHGRALTSLASRGPSPTDMGPAPCTIDGAAELHEHHSPPTIPAAIGVTNSSTSMPGARHQSIDHPATTPNSRTAVPIHQPRPGSVQRPNAARTTSAHEPIGAKDRGRPSRTTTPRTPRRRCARHPRTSARAGTRPRGRAVRPAARPTGGRGRTGSDGVAPGPPRAELVAGHRSVTRASRHRTGCGIVCRSAPERRQPCGPATSSAHTTPYRSRSCPASGAHADGPSGCRTSAPSSRPAQYRSISAASSPCTYT